ncbi:hypothetical protein [Mesorhizobium sp. ESP-6-2]|uniref:ADP-ribosyltransferase-containing protein n=1 Tax=Mesorhizobium sp. ESP-6-2 TaxID=2876625 RepID=UPI001CCA07EE|nr:hypothetical protein [Mesorhizobium sp. ESP-6-2]MBZ9807702.1 hypothetical protein [Mesorhizobium sp. ESP-6-2]
MSDVYSFTPGPTYRGANRQELFDAAMEQPLSVTSTLMDQAKGGVLQSFGLGTFLKDKLVPEEAPTTPGTPRIVPNGEGGFTYKRETPEEMAQRRADMGALSEDEYKSSPFFRKDIPWDAGMTTARAASLAQFDDAQKVRDHYASKRPIAAFIGNLGGQALDPINYIPVVGETVKAAQIARFGYVAGHALTAAADAALNTGIASVATAGERAKFGDDVSWQATLSQMATAALIGGAFGTVHGAIGSRVDARVRAEAEQRLSTLRTTQEARIALNEGIDAVVRGDDVNLSPNSTEPMARIADEISRDNPANGIIRTQPDPAGMSPVEAYHGTLADFERFDPKFLGTETQVGSAREAFFFSSDARVSEGYAQTVNPYQEGVAAKIFRGKLGEFYTKINEAIVKLIRGKGLIEEGQILRTRLRMDNPKIIDRKGAEVVDSELLDAIKTAKAEGHDGVVFKNSRDPGYTDASDIPSDVYAVFDPNKIDILSKHKDAASAAAARGQASAQPIRPAVDTTKARPDPIPEGRKQAETAIAKPDDSKALAAQYRVDPQTGGFHEEADIAQLASEGRLTEEDVMTLSQSQADFETGAAYGEALKSVAGCLL